MNEEILNLCAEALYLAERTHTSLPFEPWESVSLQVKSYCRRRAMAVLDAVPSAPFQVNVVNNEDDGA